jgi:hypothetical protein
MAWPWQLILIASELHLLYYWCLPAPVHVNKPQRERVCPVLWLRRGAYRHSPLRGSGLTGSQAERRGKLELFHLLSTAWTCAVAVLRIGWLTKASGWSRNTALRHRCKCWLKFALVAVSGKTCAHCKIPFSDSIPYISFQLQLVGFTFLLFWFMHNNFNLMYDDDIKGL